MSTTDSPRILYLHRECSLPGMAKAFMDRATTIVGCQSKPAQHYQNWPHLIYSSAVHRQIRAELRAGKYDVVATLSDPELRWRPDAPWLRNVFTHVKKRLTRFPAFGIPRLVAEAAEAGVPIIVYDDEDNQELAYKNWPLLDASKYYFKAHTPANTFHCFLFQTRRTESIWNVFRKPEFIARAKKVRPMSAGFEVPDYLDECLSPEKKSDVFYSGAVDHCIPRQQAVAILERLRAEGLKVDIPTERLDHRAFLRRMSEAWLTLSPEGASPDSFRFYESPMVKSVPLINNIGHRRHFPHRDREHCLYYHVEGDDLADKIRWALEHKDLLHDIAEKGHEMVMAHHQYHQLIDFMIRAGLKKS